MDRALISATERRATFIVPHFFSFLFPGNGVHREVMSCCPIRQKLNSQRMVVPANADGTRIVPHALYAEKSNAQNPRREFSVGLGSKISISHLLFPHVIYIDQASPMSQSQILAALASRNLPCVVQYSQGRAFVSSPHLVDLEGLEEADKEHP